MSSTRIFALMGLTAGLLATASAYAEEGMEKGKEKEQLFRYNYVELDYLNGHSETQISSNTTNDTLLGGIFSVAVHDLVAIQAAYGKTKSTWSIPGRATNTDGNELWVGVDLHKMVGEATEVGIDIARNRLKSNTTDTTGGATTLTSATDYANTWGVRVRTAPWTPEFRLLGAVTRATGGNLPNTTDYGVGVEYEIGERFSVGLAYDLVTANIGNSRNITLGGRYYWR